VKDASAGCSGWDSDKRSAVVVVWPSTFHDDEGEEAEEKNGLEEEEEDVKEKEEGEEAEEGEDEE